MPPTLESTIANNVVGTCTNLTPLMNVAATNPTKSPTTPPPNAIMTVSLVHLFSRSQSSMLALTCRDFDCSPGGMTKEMKRGFGEGGEEGRNDVKESWNDLR